MRLLLISAFCATFAVSSFAQNDTTFLYFNKGWKVCAKDTAFYYGKVYMQGDLWGRKDYWVEGNKLQMEATYLDKECKTAHGLSKYYEQDGILNSSIDYENGQKQTSDYFYKSGKLKGRIVYSKKGDKQQGWDEDGNEIRGYIVEREARFKGGLDAWRRYLERNLKANVAAKAGAPIGVYTVTVQFIVDKSGNIANVQAISVPELCDLCGDEAVRVIKNGPTWEPAVQYNKNVIYQAIQSVTFQVAER